MTGYDVLVVGAGITGLTIAERCASVGKNVLVVDKREHLGGNCFEEEVKGVRVHRYGPHVFHTASPKVSEYLGQFTDWRPYEHRVLSEVKGKLMPVPVNATTLEMFFDVELPTEKYVERFLLAKQKKIPRPKNSEEVCLSRVGEELYEAMFLQYTLKAWGRHPKDLAPGVCGRIPVRFTRDDRYFTDAFQAMPADGYTAMFEQMLEAHPGKIEVALGEEVTPHGNLMKMGKPVVWTGPLDQAFGYSHGKLPWRSLEFKLVFHHAVRYQRAAVINRPAANVPYTRTTDYDWLTSSSTDWTAIHHEYPFEGGEPYYPVPSEDANALAEEYKKMAKESDLIVCGRLGRYQYLEMGQAVASALKTFESELALH